MKLRHAFFCLLSTLGTCVMAHAAVVTFPDAGLDAAVRAAINKPTGDILDTDLVGTGFVVLNADLRNIADLTGIENCTDLVLLSLIHNQITDLSPLSSLTNLMTLIAKENGITNLAPLSALSNLQTLSLDDNQVAALTPLSGMTGLTNLYLDRNQVSDLSPLSGLANLQLLHMTSNSISDIAPLSGLNALTDLELVSNQITDITPLVECAGLDTGDVVSLSGNALSQDALCNQVPVLQARGVTITFDGICGIVPDECNIFWTFANEMKNFSEHQGAALSLPANFKEWDLENWPAIPPGDGIPDLWQLRLLADVYCNDAHPLHDSVVTQFHANLDALILEKPDASLNYWSTGMLSLSQESLLAICALRELDPNNYTPCQDLEKSVNEPFSATGDCDNDGMTNLEEYLLVASSGGNEEDYALAASENSPFWHGNPDLPITNSIGLAVLTLGMALYACRSLSRISRT